MNNLLVVGSLNMDMVLGVPALPRAGETVIGALGGCVPGGKGANQAYAGGRLGSGTAMLGMVGGDEYGRTLLDNLRQAGVDVSRVAVRADAPTGQAIVCVSESGENSIVVVPGANALCDASYIRLNEDAIADSRVILVQMEIPLEAVRETIRLARLHGRTLVLNPAPASRPLPAEMLAQVDYLIPNETELECLSGCPVDGAASAEAAARRLTDMGVGHVVATLGSLGAFYLSGDEAALCPAFSVKAVDTTAAGDTFCATFAMGLAQGRTVSESLRFANAAGALCVTRRGAQPSIPSLQEVTAFVDERQEAMRA